MLKAEDYLPFQLNGEFATMLFEELSKPLSDSEQMLWQIYNFSLDTATGTNLDYLGQIIGFERPITPDRISSVDAFTFLDNDPRKDENMGFSSNATPYGGASFLSYSDVHGALLNDSLYRQALYAYAILKEGGYNFNNIARVCTKFFKKYVICVNHADLLGDILVLAEGDTEPNRWLLETVFNDWSYAPSIVFTIEPTLPDIPDGYHLVGGGN